MAVLETVSVMRASRNAARLVRFEPNTPPGGNAITATNVQDAIDLEIGGGNVNADNITTGSQTGTGPMVRANAPTFTGVVTSSGPLHITDTTASVSSVTGALTVSGGVGIAGNLNVGGNIPSPILTGIPTAPTATVGTNTTQIATTAFVSAAISGSGGVTPAALTKTDDTNVTLTLGGTPATALLQATSITVGWSGTLGLARGGTGASLAATGGAGQYLKQSSSGAAITVGTIPASDIGSGTALTRTNDTNVTLTLGGTPATALLQATSITAGWSGTLSAARGGFAADVSASNGVPIFTTGVAAFTATTGSGNVVLATSPTLAGSPLAPTQAANDNSTKIATTAYVDTGLALDMKLAGNQTTTGGFNVTPFNAGTFSTGTFTPSALNHNYQYYLNNGAHTLAAPTIDSAMDILVQNSVAPGAITFSNFRVGAATGDPYSTAARASIAATFTNASSTITTTGHGLVAGDPLYFTTTGTLPTNFSPSTIYRCVSVLSANTYTVSATVGGTAIVAGSAGSGTHTMVAPSQFVISIRRVNGVPTYQIKALQ